MKRKKYLTDLTEGEWLLVKKYLTVSYTKGGRPLKFEKRELLNGIFYVLRTGCQWRYLPHDLPPWTAVYKQFQRWKRAGIFEKINHALTKIARIAVGRKGSPSKSIADSQSVKTTEKGGLVVMTVARG